MDNIQFNDIFNLDEIQHLQDLFSETTGVASIIAHPDGKPITKPSNFCDLCANIMRKSYKGLAKCYDSNELLGMYNPRGPLLQPCLGCGMWNAGASITVGNKHMATWLIGQIRTEEVDDQLLVNYADDIGADREEFIKAYRRVPFMPLEQFHKVSNMLFAFANEISEKAYGNFLLKRQIAEHEKTISEKKEVEEQYKALFDLSNDAIFSVDLKTGIYLNVNKAAEILTGRSADELKKLKTSDLTPKDADKRLVKITGVKETIELGEVEYHRPDGSIRTALLSSIPLNERKIFGIAHDITKRKQLDIALKNSLALNEATLESIHNGILVVNDQGTVIKTNAKFAEMWGIPEEILASGDDKILIGSVLAQLADADSFIAKVAELYEKPEAESLDVINLKDGRIFKRISKPMYLGGKPKGRVWSFLDITERIRAEEALLNSKAHLHTLIQTIPDLVWLKDPSGAYISCNILFERLVGAREEEIVGKTDYDLFDHDNADFFRSNDRKAIAAGKPTNNEEWLTFANDGHRALLEVIKTPMFDSKGTLIGVLGIGHDITERKRMEEDLKDSEDKFSKAFLLSPYAITITSAKDGKFVEINDAFTSLSGFTREEALADSSTGLNLWANIEDRKQVISTLLNGGEIEGKEFLFKKKDNQIVTGLFSAQVIHLNNEPFILSSINDITYRKLAETEIKLKNEQLILAHAEKDKFFSIIAHDLRSPFSSFLGLTQILDEELSELTLDQIHELTHSMKNSASNLYRLLENLLQWARMQQGLMPFHPTLLQLYPIVEECISIAREPAKNKGIELNFSVSENIDVFADLNTLLTVIRNLVSNAMKFTTRGGAIDVFAEISDNKSVVISVKDTGIGMSPELLANLFRIDVRTSRPGTEGESSTGLGLMLCKEFIEKHGGKLWVESEVERGSTFYFTLPHTISDEII